MGRPRDDFAWAQVEVSSGYGWKCKYCSEEFKGSASRIRNHLSGQGNDIKACRNVPREVREEALKRTPIKRRVGEDNDGVVANIAAAPPLQVNDVNVVEGREMSYVEEENGIDWVQHFLPPPNTQVHGVPTTSQFPRSAGGLVNTGSNPAPFLGSSSSDWFNDAIGRWPVTNIAASTVATPTSSALNGYASQFLKDPSPSSSNNNLFTISATREESVTLRIGTADMDIAPAAATSFTSSALNECLQQLIKDPSRSLSNDRISITTRGESVTQRSIDTSIGLLPSVDIATREESVTHTRDHRKIEALAVGLSSAHLNEEYVINALVKFLMCTNPDVIKDPKFREFLEKAHQHGVPASLLRGDSFAIERSLVNIKQEVYQYTLMVKESWKTTGRTWMVFNMNHERRGKFSAFEKDKYVVGFYCQKGFIFMEAPDSSFPRGNEFEDALKRHSPSLYIDDDEIRLIICHHSEFEKLGEDHLCELSDDSTSAILNTDYKEVVLSCLRHGIQGMCIDVCTRSEWAQSLIEKAVEIHEHICNHWSLRHWYIKILTRKGERFKKLANISATNASGLSTFLSIMLLEDELKEKLSYHLRFGQNIRNRAELDAILDDSKFWDDGRGLKRVLTPVLKIPDLMDTLVPTSGYLAMAIDKVKHTLGYERVTMGEEAFTLWQDLDLELELIIAGSRVAASYLNPVYFLQEDVQKHPDFLKKLIEAFHEFVHEEEERGKLDQELERYGDVFSSLSADVVLTNYHPVKLWEQYGHGLPLLRKYAIKLLSQPLTCMCNQVKKHLVQLQGEDDYILRLNVRMMEEFRNLGDDIYKPIDLEELQRRVN